MIPPLALPIAWTLTAAIAALGPAKATADAPAPSVRPADAAPGDAYDDAAAKADVETILADTSKAYLQARARLVAHPEPAVAALLQRLDATPPPTGSDRKRILDVLAEIGGADNVQRFADELRRAATQASGDARALASAEIWRPLLREQGALAMGPLVRLVGDKDMPLPVRSALLEDLVVVTPADRLVELLVLVGRGHTTLRQQLGRSLRRRVLRDADLRASLLAAIDAEIERADATRLAALLQLRAGIADASDQGFVQQLVALATDDAKPFPVRVAALRALAGTTDDARAREGLRGVATASLASPHAGTQQGEILAWLALSALPPKDAAELAASHDLLHADAPRLAGVAWNVVPLPATASWLDQAFTDPWPQVRRAALARVKGPCDRASIGKLRARVGQRGGDDDPAVQRAAVEAISRCGGDRSFAVLRGMLDDGDVHTEQSAEAARQLVRNFGGRGADVVAKRLQRGQEASWARRLAQSLRHATAPTPRVREALCDAAEDGGEVGRAAAQSLAALWPGESDHCSAE